MTRMNKSNARDILSQTLDQFNKITGEFVGACCTWSGSLSVIGPTEFREAIGKNTDEIWRSLMGLNTPNKELKSLKDEAMCEQLTGDVEKYNRGTLRKLISWGTQKSVGRVRNFWGLVECTPDWWPSDIPFQCISNSAQTNKKQTQNNGPATPAYNFDRRSLIKILKEYIKYSKNKINCDQDETIPTPSLNNQTKINSNNSKRMQSHCSDCNDSSPKSCKLDYSLSDQNNSYFEGLLDTPLRRINSELTTSTPIHPTPPSINKANQLKSIDQINFRQLQPSLKNKCLTELSVETMLSDNTINAFCLLLKNSSSNFCGFQDTILSQKQGFKIINQNCNYVQIHHNGASHWVCSFRNMSGETFLYDSLYKGHITSDLELQLVQIYSDGTGELTLTVPTIQQQSGFYDCGLFALAVAVSLVFGLDPVSQSWEQKLMRTHCHNCFLLEKIMLFPGITKGRRTGKLPQPKKIKLNTFIKN